MFTKEEREAIFKSSDLPVRVQESILNSVEYLMYCDTVEDLDDDFEAVDRNLNVLQMFQVLCPRELWRLKKMINVNYAERKHQLKEQEEQ